MPDSKSSQRRSSLREMTERELDALELCSGELIAGRFRIQEEIGRGAMGVVWRANDEILGKVRALKFLAPALSHDEEAVADLRAEVARCQDLTHPHIIRVHDLMEDRARGLVAISMEMAAGGTLTHRRRGRPQQWFEPDEIAPWTRQLCDALAYAHEEGRIVHRDLKPANLLLDEARRLKVADFGIASRLTDSLRRVTGGRVEGTLCYMSPEQAQGAPARVSDDLYALGATLYELLTGRPPFFSGQILPQLLQVIPPMMANRRRELRGIKAPLPRVWEQVVAALLAKSAEERPVSAREVIARLGLGGLAAGSATAVFETAPKQWSGPAVPATLLRIVPPPEIAGVKARQIVPATLPRIVAPPRPSEPLVSPEDTTSVERRVISALVFPTMKGIRWALGLFAAWLVWLGWQVADDGAWRRWIRLPTFGQASTPRPRATTPAPTPLIAEIAAATPARSARKAPAGMIRLTRATEVVLRGERVQLDAGTPLRVESAVAGMVNVRVGLEVIAIPAANTDYGSP